MGCIGRKLGGRGDGKLDRKVDRWVGGRLAWVSGCIDGLL